MARKVHEISFAIAGRMASTFRGSFASASSQIRGLNQDTKQLKASIRELGIQQKSSAISVEAYSLAHQKLTQQLEKTQQAQQRLSQAMQRQNELQNKASQIRGNMVDTVAMAAPFVIAAREAIKFEDAMVGVAKQADGARDAQGKLTSVYYDTRKQIQALGREIPIPTNALAGMVEAGLRMGVAKDKVIQFTRETSKIASAFDGMSPDEIADKMGKISNVMNIPITKLSDLGDTLNFLDDNSVSKGSDIINTLLRIGGTAKQVNMSEHQAAALASTFLSLGKSEEVAATASNALMRELSLANQQPKKFQKALEKLGMTSEQVNKGMVKDAQGTIFKVLDGINALDKSKQVEVTTGLFGKEYGDDVAALAGSIKEYRRQLALLNDEKRKGSMDREFEARLDLTSSKLQLMKNSATEAGVAVGNVLLPGLTNAASGIAKGAQAAAEFAEKYPGLTNTVVTGTTVVAGASLAWSGLRFVWTQVSSMGNALKILFLRQAAAQTTATTATAIHTTAQNVATASTTRLTIAQRLLNVAMRLNPIGLVITGIGLLVAAGVYLYNNWELVGAKAGELWDEIGNSFKRGVNWAIDSINVLIDGINKIPGVEIGHIGHMKMAATSESAERMGMADNQARRYFGIDGSHANGLSNVPFDGYIAELHEGERVLTAQENQDYSGGMPWQRTGSLSGGGGSTIIHVNYNPTLVGVNQSEIEPVLRDDKRNLVQQLQSIQHQQGRVSYGSTS